MSYTTKTFLPNPRALPGDAFMGDEWRSGSHPLEDAEDWQKEYFGYDILWLDLEAPYMPMKGYACRIKITGRMMHPTHTGGWKIRATLQTWDDNEEPKAPFGGWLYLNAGWNNPARWTETLFECGEHAEAARLARAISNESQTATVERYGNTYYIAVYKGLTLHHLA